MIEFVKYGTQWHSRFMNAILSRLIFLTSELVAIGSEQAGDAARNGRGIGRRDQRRVPATLLGLAGVGVAPPTALRSLQPPLLLAPLARRLAGRRRLARRGAIAIGGVEGRPIVAGCVVCTACRSRSVVCAASEVAANCVGFDSMFADRPCSTWRPGRSCPAKRPCALRRTCLAGRARARDSAARACRRSPRGYRLAQ